MFVSVFCFCANRSWKSFTFGLATIFRTTVSFLFAQFRQMCKCLSKVNLRHYLLSGDQFKIETSFGQFSLKIFLRNHFSTEWTNRLLHRKCDVRIFIHELRDFGKRTSERSERVSFPKSCNEWIKIRTKHFLCCNLFIVYITRIKQTH